MRVVLTASATRGDLQPMFALAVALKAKGHDATVVGPPNFSNEAACFGIDYRPFGRDTRMLMTRNQDDLNGGALAMIRVFRAEVVKQLQAEFEVVKEVAKGADLVLAAGLALSTASVAEHLKVPYRLVAYAPETVPSDFHAPLICPFRNLPPLLNRAVWRAFGAASNWLMKDTLNTQRAEVDLAPLTDVVQHAFRSDRVVVAADPALVSWPADLAHLPPPTGAWLLPDKRELGAKLEAFLDDGEPPVYIGFGSMVDADPGATTALITAAVERVGCRAVIGTGWSNLGGADHGPRIFTTEDVPHAALFRRVRAVVHHGGAGTTHAAMYAGVPQVIVPQLLDQIVWANRVYERGLSPRPVRRPDLTVDSLAANISACLADEGMRARARGLRETAFSRDGTGTALAALERLVDAPRPSLRPTSPSRAPRANALAA